VVQFHNPNIDRKPVVLIVEDDIVLRSLVATWLRDSDFRVVEAGNAQEAIIVLTSGPAVDVVFADVNMPGTMNGVELAHWVRQHHGDIPVLVTTGARDRLDFADKIADEQFIPKPYIFEDVENRLRRFLHEP
jgi:CheY-like chemotaxis protein